MTRKFVEVRLDILEDAVQSLTARHNRTLPSGIEDRIDSLERAVAALIDLTKNSLEREERQVRHELTMLGFDRQMLASKKKKTVLQRATKKPVKRRRATVRR